MRRWVDVAVFASSLVFLSAYLLSVGDVDGRLRPAQNLYVEGAFGQLVELVQTLAAAAAVAVVALAIRVLGEIRWHRRLVRRLRLEARPRRLADVDVLLVPGLTAPYVAGLVRPQIHCPPDLDERLDPDELRAVVLHEDHHRRHRAPIGLVMLAASRPILDLVPGGRAWLERRIAAIEIAADDHAIAKGVSRRVLAGALVKLSILEFEPTVAAFTSASELRLRHLMGDDSVSEPTASRLTMIAAALLGLAPCLIRGLTV